MYAYGHTSVISIVHNAKQNMHKVLVKYELRLCIMSLQGTKSLLHFFSHLSSTAYLKHPLPVCQVLLGDSILFCTWWWRHICSSLLCHYLPLLVRQLMPSSGLLPNKQFLSMIHVHLPCKNSQCIWLLLFIRSVSICNGTALYYKRFLTNVTNERCSFDSLFSSTPSKR